MIHKFTIDLCNDKWKYSSISAEVIDYSDVAFYKENDYFPAVKRSFDFEDHPDVKMAITIMMALQDRLSAAFETPQ
jgi:hypothetical protein